MPYIVILHHIGCSDTEFGHYVTHEVHPTLEAAQKCAAWWHRQQKMHCVRIFALGRLVETIDPADATPEPEWHIGDEEEPRNQCPENTVGALCRSGLYSVGDEDDGEVGLPVSVPVGTHEVVS